MAGLDHRTPIICTHISHLAEDVEAVHLVEQLHQGSLDLTVSRRSLGKSTT